MTSPEQKTRRPKRSRITPVMLGGAAAFALAGCQDDRVETQVFPSLSECQAEASKDGSWWTQEECSAAFADAEAAHKESAPRYAEEKLCNEQHGGACYAEPAPSGGGSIFLPLMAGYMMGNLMGNNNSSYKPQPIYRTSAGKFATPGGTILNSNKGSGQFRATSFRSGPSTKAAAPMTRASVKSSGGFGASRTSTSSRGFGG